MPRWEPDGRLRLIDAALDLFEADGYEQTGVKEIAQRAGLTKTTFFRHFPDKREVLFAGQEEHDALLARAIAAAPQEATAWQMVHAALKALSETQSPDRQAFNTRWQAVVDASPELRERSALKLDGYTQAIADALKARTVSPMTAAVCAELGVLAFKMAFTRWTRDKASGTLVDLVTQTLDEIHLTSAALS